MQSCQAKWVYTSIFGGFCVTVRDSVYISAMTNYCMVIAIRILISMQACPHVDGSGRLIQIKIT